MNWIAPSEFRQAFEEYSTHPAPDVSGQTLREQMMAALTNKSDPVTGATPAVFPAFIEVRYEDDKAVLTVRGDPLRNPPETGAPVMLGETVVATFTKADWEQFMSWSIRDSGLPAG